MKRTRHTNAAGQTADLHISGEYRRNPWGYAGMTVRIYRATADRIYHATEDGPAPRSLGEGGDLYAMGSSRGVIATAKTMDALADLARREMWVATYRHAAADGTVSWVSVPE